MRATQNTFVSPRPSNKRAPTKGHGSGRAITALMQHSGVPTYSISHELEREGASPVDLFWHAGSTAVRYQENSTPCRCTGGGVQAVPEQAML